MTWLAESGSAWGGVVVGLVAVGVFVVFSTYIVAQRLRAHRQAPPSGREDQADD